MSYGTFATYTLYYDRPSADFDDNGDCYDGDVKVATIVVDTKTYEVDLMVIEPDGPQAPDWFGASDLERVIDQIQDMLVATDDNTIEVRAPEEPGFRMVTGPVIQAESLTTARHMCVDFTPSMPNLYQAFTVEFRPNLTKPSTFPVAVFAVDPRALRIVAHVYGHANPHAPASLSRQQRKLIDRRVAELIRAVEVGGTADKPLSPFKNMGPQFRSEALPTAEGYDIHEALDNAVAMVDAWGCIEAS